MPSLEPDIDLPETYRNAFDDAVRYIHSRFRPDGIVASGTIIRGTPDLSSDFDLVVVHDQPWRQRVQRFFHGVPAEIFVNPPAEIRRAFVREATACRPVLAHMLASGVILHDPGDIVRSLKADAVSVLETVPQLSGLQLDQTRYAIATTFEDAIDIRDRDPERATAMILDAVIQSARLVFLKSGRWLPREKDLISDLEAMSPDLGDQCRRVIRATSIEERLALAAPFVDQIAGATGFFEWESEQQPVEM